LVAIGAYAFTQTKTSSDLSRLISKELLDTRISLLNEVDNLADKYDSKTQKKINMNLANIDRIIKIDDIQTKILKHK
jgi:UDP-glucose 6-dehydrogenase